MQWFRMVVAGNTLSSSRLALTASFVCIKSFVIGDIPLIFVKYEKNNNNNEKK
jgi:hypothetical protein